MQIPSNNSREKKNEKLRNLFNYFKEAHIKVTLICKFQSLQIPFMEGPSQIPFLEGPSQKYG